MQFRVITEATESPIDLDDLKRHLFIYNNDEDTYLTELLFAADRMCSQYLGEFISSTTVDVRNKDFSRIILPHRFITSVSSVSYYDIDNDVQIVSPSDYILDTTNDGNAIVFTRSFEAPVYSRDYSEPIIVEYITAIPVVNDTIRQAVRIVAGEMYQSRSLTTDRNVQNLPLTVVRLLQSQRRW